METKDEINPEDEILLQKEQIKKLSNFVFQQQMAQSGRIDKANVVSAVALGIAAAAYILIALMLAGVIGGGW